MEKMGAAWSRIRKVKALPLVAVVALIAFAAPALAAGSWHPISGTCYEAGGWYYSSNYRTVSSGGSAIKARFNTAPTKGMAFRVINVNTGIQIGSTIYTPPLTTQQLAGTQRAGTVFYNAFELQVPGHQANYSFDGSELY